MCTSDGEPEDTDSAINVYSSDSSARNSYKLYDTIGGDHSFGAPQRPILPELPKELELRPSTATTSTTSGGGPNHQQTFITVCARTDLKLGTIFGPYQGKIRKDPITTSFNWKVSPLLMFISNGCALIYSMSETLIVAYLSTVPKTDRISLNLFIIFGK